MHYHFGSLRFVLYLLDGQGFATEMWNLRHFAQSIVSGLEIYVILVLSESLQKIFY